MEEVEANTEPNSTVIRPRTSGLGVCVSFDYSTSRSRPGSTSLQQGLSPRTLLRSPTGRALPPSESHQRTRPQLADPKATYRNQHQGVDICLLTSILTLILFGAPTASGLSVHIHHRGCYDISPGLVSGWSSEKPHRSILGHCLLQGGPDSSSSDHPPSVNSALCLVPCHPTWRELFPGRHINFESSEAILVLLWE